MTEERRASGAEPPTVPALGDASSTTEIAALEGEPSKSARPPPAAPSAPSTESRPPRDSSPGGKRRGRMTLRIPDDEVARPELTPAPRPASQAAPAPSAPPPPVAPPLPPPPAPPPEGVVVNRIISINPAPPPEEVAVAPASVPPAPPPPKLQEDSWTPFQPTAKDGPAPAPAAARARVASEELIPVEDEPPVPSESAPESIEPLDDEAPATPPAAVRAKAPTEPEGEDVRFEDDALTPATPHVSSDGDRRSDPGAEVAADDMVIETAPPPKVVVANLPPMRPRLQSRPDAPPPPPKTTSPKLAKPPLVIVPPHVGTMAPVSSDAASARRKGRLWWEDLFNDDYLRACERLTDEQVGREVDFIEESLSIERGGAVLDLGCGTGRHAIELAKRGYEVVGFDLSLAMLARAGDEAQDRDAKLNFVQGDMREMTFDEQFDGVYCWNTSFGYFEEEKNAGVIDRIHKALKSEGLLLLDVINRDFLIRQAPSLAWFEGDGCVCMDEMNVDFITSRMKVKRTLMLDDGRSRETEYSMRVYSLHELGRILHEHGFKVTEVSGRIATPGVFFGNESPRTLILAEKR